MNSPVPEKRKPLTPLQRVKLFDAHNGICCICGEKIFGRKWVDEHIRPLGLLGTNDMENRGPAHVACAKEKTKSDVARISKAKRQRAGHIGAKKKSTMPGSRDSAWKKTLDGRTIRRG